MHWKVPGSQVPPQCCLQTRVTEPFSVSDLQDWVTAWWDAVMSGPASNVSAGEENTLPHACSHLLQRRVQWGEGAEQGRGRPALPWAWGTSPRGGGAGTDPARVLSAASFFALSPVSPPLRAESPSSAPRGGAGTDFPPVFFLLPLSFSALSPVSPHLCSESPGSALVQFPPLLPECLPEEGAEDGRGGLGTRRLVPLISDMSLGMDGDGG